MELPTSGITKRLLGDAVKECMKKQSLSKISIQDIAEKCGLNRNSFYYHFKDKYDLVNWVFYTELIAEIEQSEESLVEWEMFDFIFRFFYRDKEFYASALQEQGQNSFADYFQEVMKEALREHAEALFSESADREFFTIFFVDALLSCITRWLLSGAEQPPEEMSRLVRTVMTGAAIRILEGPAME